MPDHRGGGQVEGPVGNGAGAEAEDRGVFTAGRDGVHPGGAAHHANPVIGDGDPDIAPHLGRFVGQGKFPERGVVVHRPEGEPFVVQVPVGENPLAVAGNLYILGNGPVVPVPILHTPHLTGCPGTGCGWIPDGSRWGHHPLVESAVHPLQHTDRAFHAGRLMVLVDAGNISRDIRHHRQGDEGEQQSSYRTTKTLGHLGSPLPTGESRKMQNSANCNEMYGIVKS